ncbi:Cloroperoxidase [Amniculicola lignicola CBS 123094]|uniref:Cloroperoxidase n=1 Tax=Amniculicola lignicola CBS 123094 TaxID=1392246 RepID=A0A6A5WJN1_9PLEO|nr:Cloroperoxidase [Amniculicola lignicola CBS 123094]
MIALARPQYGEENPNAWKPAGPGDLRGPCPMMNTLANHGFIQRDGRNITRETAIAGLNAGLNFAESLATIMFDQALVANPEPNSTFFTLDMLNRHNVLEHDASLSRADSIFASPSNVNTSTANAFNATVFAETTSYWTSDTLTPLMLANSKLARQITSRKENPEYAFSTTTEEFSLGEVAAPIIAFGSLEDGTVSRELVTYFFENERLPEELGWTKKNQSIALTEITGVTTIIRAATNLFTGGAANGTSAHTGAKRSLHGF